MESLKNRNSFSVYVLIIVLIAYSALIVFTQNHQRLTADSTIYLDLAEKYLRGDFHNAINGYWGPMLAWLFIPFLFFGFSPVFAINAVNLAMGLFTVLGVWMLSHRFEISEKIRGAITLSLLSIMLFFSLVELIDFLLVCFIIFYLGIIFDNDYHHKVSRGILCGIFGALAYFSKSYAFPFFIVHFLIMNVAHFIRVSLKSERRNVLKNAAVGIAVFALISAPWITAVSMKYERFTFSNQGKGNFAPIGPDDPQTGLVRGVVIFHEGLFPPTNETATSAWEDPSYIWKDITSWSPLDSPRHFKHFIKNILRNIMETITVLETFSCLSITILIAYVLLLMAGPFDFRLLRGDRLYAVITILIYTGGYLLFHMEHRYLFTVNILLLLMGGHVVNVMTQHVFFNKKLLQNVLIAVFAVTFMVSPLKSYAQNRNNNLNKEMYSLGRLLKDRYNIQGNLASNREWEHVPIHDSWHKTFRLSYWLNSRYYGQTRAVVSDAELSGELSKHDIDFYFVWGKSQNIPDILSRYKEVTNGVFPDLKIYSMKEEIK